MKDLGKMMSLTARDESITPSQRLSKGNSILMTSPTSRTNGYTMTDNSRTMKRMAKATSN